MWRASHRGPFVAVPDATPIVYLSQGTLISSSRPPPSETLISTPGPLPESGCAALEPLLQPLLVTGKLPFCLRADDERHEQLADPVTLEIELDRHPRPLAVLERL